MWAIILQLDVLTANFTYAVYIRFWVRVSPSSPSPSLSLLCYPSFPSYPLLPFPPSSLFLSLSVSYSPSLNLRIPSDC